MARPLALRIGSQRDAPALSVAKKKADATSLLLKDDPLNVGRPRQFGRDEAPADGASRRDQAQLEPIGSRRERKNRVGSGERDDLAEGAGENAAGGGEFRISYNV